jgi:flagellar biosynthetic protein FliS
MLAFEKYRTAAATTTDSSHQLIFIFDEVMKLLHRAQKGIVERDLETKFKALSRAIEVFYILKSGIDLETADESTKTIDVFYGATIVQLEKINMTDGEAEELQLMIDAIGEVRSAIITSFDGHSEQDKLVANDSSEVSEA